MSQVKNRIYCKLKGVLLSFYYKRFIEKPLWNAHQIEETELGAGTVYMWKCKRCGDKKLKWTPNINQTPDWIPNE